MLLLILQFKQLKGAGSLLPGLRTENSSRP
jgi:hypothetical protein